MEMKLTQKILSACVAAVCLFGSTGSSIKAAQPDSLTPIVAVLNQSQDAGFQLDVLRGLSQAMQGRAKVAMPEGWSGVETKLGKSNNAEVRSLVRSLSLPSRKTFPVLRL